MYNLRVECWPNVVGVGDGVVAKGFICGGVQPVHAHSGERNSESLVCVYTATRNGTV